MQRVNVATALIFDEIENILMVKNKNKGNPYWSLPGGYVEPEESLTETVIREVKEETGYTVSVINLYSVREVIFTQRKHHSIIFTFQAKITGGEINISDPDNEILEARWYDLSTANKLLTYLPEQIKYIHSNDQLYPYHFQISHNF